MNPVLIEQPAETKSRYGHEHYIRSTKMPVQDYGSKLTGDEGENLIGNSRRTRARTQRQKERHRELMRDYAKNLDPEKKEQRRQKQCEYQKNLSPRKKEERRRKHREYLRNLSPGRKEEDRQKRNKNRMKKIQTKELIKRPRKYVRRITDEQKQSRNQTIHEYCKKQTIENNKRGQKIFECYEESTSNENEYSEEILNIARSEKNAVIEQPVRDAKQKVFCYKCQMHFLDNCALLEHITKHITLPLLTVSKLDKHKITLYTVQNKKESTQISQNVTCVKTRCNDNNEDIVCEFDNNCMSSETEIDIDDISFYTHIKKEMEHIE